MEHAQQEIDVLCVPGASFAIDDFLDFVLWIGMSCILGAECGGVFLEY